LNSRLSNALVSYVRYLEKLIWPTDLAPIYPYVQQWPKERVILSALLLAVVSVGVLWRRNRNPYLLVGWLWFLGTLVPVIGLLQNGSQSMADRYSYLPSIGVFFAVVWGVADCLGKPESHARTLPGGGTVRDALVSVATTTVLLVLGALTYRQVKKWQDTETLFRYALSVTTNNFIAYTNLGFYYANLHDNAQAMSCFQSALGINPEWAFSWAGMGKVLAEQGKFPEAISNCQTALRLDPRLAEPHGTIGFALMQQGQVKEAIEEYRTTLRLRPTYASAHYDLGNALARQGQMEEAAAHYEQAIRFGIGSADAHNNLAYILVRLHKLDAAVAEFKAAISLQPEMWQALYGLGDTLSRQDRYGEAVAAFSEAVRARPDFVEALNRLAWLLATNPEARLRDGAQAIALAGKACRLSNYSQPIMLRTLAAAHAEAGQFGEAIAAAEKARSQALSGGQNELANRIEELLTLFRAGKAFHEKSARDATQQ
jgi:tetratricopeptide (TPR) repeat protein